MKTRVIMKKNISAKMKDILPCTVADFPSVSQTRRYPEAAVQLHQTIEDLIQYPDIFCGSCKGRVQTGDSPRLIVPENLQLSLFLMGTGS